jgi:hypothetical protein
MASRTATLAAMIADLGGYIERHAAELAEPKIDAAQAAAAEEVRLARRETQRQEDLVTELRRRLTAQERITERLRAEAEARSRGETRIVPWREVLVDDLVLRHGRLMHVTSISAIREGREVSVGYGDEADFGAEFSAALVAVRRSLKENPDAT